jgi:hypothetical protein
MDALPKVPSAGAILSFPLVTSSLFHSIFRPFWAVAVVGRPWLFLLRSLLFDGNIVVDVHPVADADWPPSRPSLFAAVGRRLHSFSWPLSRSGLGHRIGSSHRSTGQVFLAFGRAQLWLKNLVGFLKGKYF